MVNIKHKNPILIISSVDSFDFSEFITLNLDVTVWLDEYEYIKRHKVFQLHFKH